MLKKAWKMRKRIRANQNNQKQERKRRKKADASASPKHDNRAKRQAVEEERMQNMEGERPAVHARKEESVSEDTPPDWGGHSWTRGRTARVRPVAVGFRRPSDRDSATGRLAAKPNEPMGEPPPRSTRPRTATERPKEPDKEPPRRSPPREQETRGGKTSCEPGPQPQLASASAHGKKAERYDKVQH